MSLRRPAAFLAFAVCLVHASGAFAQAPIVDARELDERLKRIERLLGSESLLKLFDEVESLGTEVRELRGQLEVMSHTINQLKERQRELYLDTDQRPFSASNPEHRLRPRARHRSRPRLSSPLPRR